MIVKFELDTINGITISWIKRDDGKRRIHSILDPDRESVAIRHFNGIQILGTEDEPEPNGLIVFGINKYSRWKASEVIKYYPEYSEIISVLTNDKKLYFNRALKLTQPKIKMDEKIKIEPETGHRMDTSFNPPIDLDEIEETELCED